jgi:hypothetical protein
MSKYNELYDNDAYIRIMQQVSSCFGNGSAYLDFMVKIQDIALWHCGETVILEPMSDYEYKVMYENIEVINKFLAPFYAVSEQLAYDEYYNETDNE